MYQIDLPHTYYNRGIGLCLYRGLCLFNNRKIITKNVSGKNCFSAIIIFKTYKNLLRFFIVKNMGEVLFLLSLTLNVVVLYNL